MNISNKENLIFPIWAIWIIGITFLATLFLHHDIALLARTNSPHDDSLYFRGMEFLLNGEWLGPYDNLTLARSPMLSLIAAFATITGIPFKTFEFLLYLLVALFFAILTWRLSRSALLMVAVFIALSLNPVFDSTSALRFIREPIYLSLSMALIGLTIWILYLAKNHRHQWLMSLGLGSIFGMFYLMREEGIWIYPALGLVLSFKLLKPQMDMTYKQALIVNATNVVILLIGLVIGSNIIFLPITLLNNYNYGKFIISELRSAEFKAAVGALMRIDAPATSPNFPVSRKALKLAYTVSQAAFELRPALDGGLGAAWAGGVNKEIVGGKFIFALRDAVVMAGYHHDAVSAAAFYKRLSEEINVACDQKRLPCNIRRDTLAPPFPWQRLNEFWNAAMKSLWMIASLEASPIQPVYSKDPMGRLNIWNELLGKVAPTAASVVEKTVISGWLAYPQQMPALAIRTSGSQAHSFELELKPAPDVDNFLIRQGRQKMFSRRFVLISDCVTEDCVLLAVAGDTLNKSWSLSTLKAGGLKLNDGFTLTVDSINREAKSSINMRPVLEALKLRIMNAYENIANKLFPALWSLATLGIFIYGISKYREERLDILALLAMSALVAIITRVLLVAYVYVTAWASTDIRFILPAYGFGIVYAVIGTYLFYKTVKAYSGSALH